MSLIYILYAKDISHTRYTVLGAYTSLNKAVHEWENYETTAVLEGKIVTMDVNKKASPFATKSRTVTKTIPGIIFNQDDE